MFHRASKKADQDDNGDPFGRPVKRILMIAGPPGLGKTTLAAIAAKQCGYETVEINASDDRTGAVVRDRISEVVSTRGIMGRKQRCVILDEIDGVWGGGGDGGFIGVLVGMLTADQRASRAPYKSKQHKKGARNRQRKHLLRPIICICNDPYSPVLRALRQYVQIITMKKPPVNSLVQRLLHVCKSERLRSDLRVLSALAESLECDVRSCLNALQSIGTGNDKLNMEMLENGLLFNKKDFNRTSHNVTEALFAKDIRRQFSSARKEMEHVLSLADSNGEYDRIAQCRLLT